MKYLALGEDQQLSLQSTDKPKVAGSQCLVKVSAIGVNRADILQKQGKYPAPKGESDILGLEVSGEIVQIGDNVNDRQVGDHVYGLVAGGGYAEYVAIESAHILEMPNNLSSVQCAGIAEVFLTAYQSLFMVGELKKKQTVLVHAGASGVGTAAIQLAKYLGCYVIATVGNDEKVQACLKLGADEVLNYKKHDFLDFCKVKVPKGFDVIIDVVAGEYINKNIKLLAMDGNLVVLSMLGGRFTKEIDCAKLLQKRASIKASTLRNRSHLYKSELVSQFSHTFGQALKAGEISPVIDKVFDWSQSEKAHQYIVENQNIGKVILMVSKY